MKMSLGLLGSYDSDSDSEGAETGERGVRTTSVGASSEVHTELPHDTDAKPCESVSTNVRDTVIPAHCTGATGTEEVVETEKTDSPAVSYGLSGEGDLIDSDSSNSPSSDEEGEEECEDGGKIREKSPLPLPVLDGSDKIPASVFSNPYREAEEARLAVLKQHVDLSHHVEPSRKQRRKWSKRGKFRGGHLQACESGGLSSGNQCWDDRDSPMGVGGGMGRKHRSGVGDGLQPPKKFMKIHQKIQSKERPWTR
jgi:hypothetical protein